MKDQKVKKYKLKLIYFKILISTKSQKTLSILNQDQSAKNHKELRFLKVKFKNKIVCHVFLKTKVISFLRAQSLENQINSI